VAVLSLICVVAEGSQPVRHGSLSNLLTRDYFHSLHYAYTYLFDQHHVVVMPHRDLIGYLGKFVALNT
jgi:hypothetical protein